MDDIQFLAEMRKNFDASVKAEAKLRKASKQSSDMVHGKQWSDEDLKLREGRPSFTFNKMRKYVSSICGEIIQNMPDFDIATVQEKGFLDVQVLRFLKTYIEKESNADDAKTVAIKDQVSSGIGYIFVGYEDSKIEPNSREIKIIPIRNRFTVHLDQDSNKSTYEDGRWAFISEMIPNKEYEKLYKDVPKNDFPADEFGSVSDWHEDGQTRVALYFYKEPKKVTFVRVEDQEGELSVFELDKTITKKFLEENGFIIVDEEEKEKDRVMWCKVSGKSILVPAQEYPIRSDKIPIIPFLGAEENEGGERIYRGVAYDAESAQQCYNYVVTKMVEMMALQFLAPITATDKQIEGYEAFYVDANRKPISVLPYNHDSMEPGPPRRLDVPQASPGLINLAGTNDSDIADIIGRGNASMGAPTRERTGAAIEASKKFSDIIFYTFFANAMSGMQYLGQIILDMIPLVYDNERVIRMLQGNTLLEMPINKAYRDYNGDEVMLNDITEGHYEYVATSSLSQIAQRQEAQQALLNIMQIAPEYRGAFISSFIEGSDFVNKNKMLQVIEGINKKMEAQAQMQQGGEEQNGEQQKQIAMQAGGSPNQFGTTAV